jgi:hypothetical protein
MTFSSYWERLLRINKDMNGGDKQKLTITVGALKKALKRSYDVGRKDEAERSSGNDIFGGIFGAKK